MVEDAPTFAEVWPQMVPLMEGAAVVAAHNASFDRRVLGACCERAGLAFPTRHAVIEVSQPVGHSLTTSRVVVVELEEMRQAAWRDPFLFEGERYQPVWWRSGLSDYLGGSSWRHPDLGQMAFLTVLRDFTYQWIKGELKTPLEALAQLCDLPPFR